MTRRRRVIAERRARWGILIHNLEEGDQATSARRVVTPTEAWQRPSSRLIDLYLAHERNTHRSARRGRRAWTSATGCRNRPRTTCFSLTLSLSLARALSLSLSRSLFLSSLSLTSRKNYLADARRADADGNNNVDTTDNAFNGQPVESFKTDQPTNAPLPSLLHRLLGAALDSSRRSLGCHS